MVIVNVFTFKRTAASAIERLCNQILEQAWNITPDYEWLLAVPLMHFLRGDSKPFEEPEMGGQPDNSAWWGAENLNLGNLKPFDEE